MQLGMITFTDSSTGNVRAADTAVTAACSTASAPTTVSDVNDPSWQNKNYVEPTPGPLLFEWSTPFRFDEYTIYSSTDSPERDPVEWTVHASADNIDWVLLHENHDEWAMPWHRSSSASFHFNAISFQSFRWVPLHFMQDSIQVQVLRFYRGSSQVWLAAPQAIAPGDRPIYGYGTFDAPDYAVQEYGVWSESDIVPLVVQQQYWYWYIHIDSYVVVLPTWVNADSNPQRFLLQVQQMGSSSWLQVNEVEADVNYNYTSGISPKFHFEPSSCSRQITSINVSKLRFSVVTLQDQIGAIALELTELQVYANGFILQNLINATVTPAGDVGTEATFAFDDTEAGFASKMRESLEVELPSAIDLEGYRFITSGTVGHTPIRWELHGESNGQWFIVHQMQNDVSAPSVNTASPMYYVNPLMTAVNNILVRYIRFTPLGLRLYYIDGTGQYQAAATSAWILSEIELLVGGSILQPVSSASVVALTDGDYTTELSVNGMNPVTIYLGQSVYLEAFRLVTASSNADHDPVQFRMEGSFDGANYFDLYEQSFSTALDLARRKASPWYYVSTTTTTSTQIAMTDALITLDPTALCGLSTPVTVKYVRLVLSYSRALMAWDNIGGWQLQELELFDIFGKQLDLSMATVFCENAHPSYPASNAVDRNSASKFVSEYMSDLRITFWAPVEVYMWRIRFGVDEPNRDPTELDLQGSMDGSNWNVLDARNVGADPDPGRLAYSSLFTLKHQYSTLAIEVRSVQFYCDSPRQWNAWVGVRTSTQWRLTEIQFLVGNQILPLGSATVQLLGGLSPTTTDEFTDGNVYTPSGPLADSTQYIEVTFYIPVMLQAFRFYGGTNQHQDCSQFTLTGLTVSGQTQDLYVQSGITGIPYERNTATPWFYLGHKNEETSTTTTSYTWTTRTWTTRTFTSTSTATTATTTTTSTTSSSTTSTSTTSTSNTATSTTTITTSTTSRSTTSTSTTSTSSTRTETSMTNTSTSSTSTTSISTTSSSTTQTSSRTTSSTMSSKTSSSTTTSATSSQTTTSSWTISSSTSTTRSTATTSSSLMMSTSSTSTFNITSDLFSGTSSVTKTSTTSAPSALTQALTEAVGAFENGLRQATQDLLSNLTNTSTGSFVLGTSSLDSDDYAFTAMAIAVPPGEATEIPLQFDEVTILLDTALVEALGGLVVLGVGQPGAGNQILNSSGPSDVLAMTAISITFPNGSEIRGDLPRPLRFILSRGNETDGNLSCSYWDETTLTWSERGVRLVSISADGNSILCETSHLSIFALISKAFLAALFCSNAATIFSLEGLKSLGERPWFLEMPAIFNMIVIFIGLVLMYCAHRSDLRNKKNVQLSLSLLHLQDSKQQHHGFWQQLMEQLELSWRHPANFVYSSEVRKATGLSISRLMVMYEHTGHGMLHGIAEETLRKMNQKGWRARVLLWYQVNCKWLKFLHVNLRSTCRMRCAVLLAKLYSGWAMAAMFFDASAIAPGADEGCVPPETQLERILTSCFVSIISTLFGAMPLALLLILFQREKVPESLRVVVFWGFTILYFVGCALMIAIFLASVSPHDGTKWLQCSLIGLGIDLLIHPLAVSLFFSILLCRYSEQEMEVLPWESYDFELYHVQGFELVVQSGSQDELTATCEVAGHPHTAISMEFQNKDGGSTFRCPQEAFLELKSKQQILLSVYRMKRPRPPKLLGTAAVKMDDLVHRDFRGTLHLQLNHHQVRGTAVGVSIPRAKIKEAAETMIHADMANMAEKVLPSDDHEIQERQETLVDAPEAKDAEEPQIQKVEEVVEFAVPISVVPTAMLPEAASPEDHDDHREFVTLDVEEEELPDLIPHEAVPMVARDHVVTVMRPIGSLDLDIVEVKDGKDAEDSKDSEDVDVELEQLEPEVAEEDLIDASLEPDTARYSDPPTPSPTSPDSQLRLETARQTARQERERIEAQREQADPEVQKLWDLAEKRKLPPREADGRTGT